MLQKQAKHIYPSFMLFDLQAHALNLNQEKIEAFIANSKPIMKKIFDLYYVQGFNQNYTAKQINTSVSSVNYHIKQLKKQLQTFAKLWNNDITLIVGRSGTGKSTLEKTLCEIYNLTAIKSYTTRPQRDENEDNHLFITPQEIDNFPNKIATTTINGHFYFATKEQLSESQIYVIDTNGLYELTANCPDLTFNLIYLQLTKKQHEKYLKSRRATSNETEKSQIERLQSENQQFDKFEQQLASKTLPTNITILKPKDLLPNYK